jgi:hypothetical protein
VTEIVVFEKGGIPRNCNNCAHRSLGKCMKSGSYCETQRKYPGAACNIDFSGWEPRASIFKRIWFSIFGY